MGKKITLGRRLLAGFAGASVLTLINEIGHRVASESPRLDVLGMRAIVHGVRATGHEPPSGRVVPLAALAGDLLLNTLYYGLALGRTRRGARTRALLAGVAAGTAAAVLVGPRLGMNDRTGYHAGRRLAMAAFYTAAGAATGATVG
jgi:hypothetical protein